MSRKVVRSGLWAGFRFVVLLGVAASVDVGHAPVFTQDANSIERLNTLRRAGIVPAGPRREAAAAGAGPRAIADLSGVLGRSEPSSSAASLPPPAEAPEPAATASREPQPAGAPDVELSAFERQLGGYDDPQVGGPVRQFGYEVFRAARQPFADLPVGGEYILGTGDRVVVSIWGGTTDQDYVETIDRQGQIRLPEVGLVALVGLSLEGAETALRREFDRFYRNYQLQTRLERLRDMPVHVVGRVAAPGRVRVSGAATLLDALAAAGGITKEGSLRRVTLRRAASPAQVFDLYQYLVEGDLSVDVSLGANDAVIVPPVGARVAITGRVLRPAIYELSAEDVGLDELLVLAGGYARLADRERVDVESVAGRGLVVRSVDLRSTPPRSVRLRDGDVAVVAGASPKAESVVYLEGNVTRPGRYAFRDGMRVSDLVTPDALVDAGFWLERLPPVPRAEDFRRVVERLKGEARGPEPFVEYPEPYLELALVRRIDLKTKQEGRLAFDLGTAIFTPGSAEDLPLQAQDTVVVFPRSAFEAKTTVYISGAVHKPGELSFFSGMRVRDLVRIAGGLLPEAHLTGAVLTRTHPDQTGVRFEHIDLDLAAVVAGAEEANLVLQPDDALAVRVVPEFRRPLRVTVEGEMRQPGTYTVIPGERLSDLLERAGGFTEHAYLPAAQFFRESVRVQQEARIQESLRRLELETQLAVQRYSAEAGATGQEVDIAKERARIEALIQEIRSVRALGRMVLRLRADESFRGSADDVELADADRITVPRRPTEVLVIGAVFNQTAHLYRKDLKTRDYLERCGGPTESAESELAYVIRADGSAESAQSSRRGFSWDPERGRYVRADLLDTRLFPGDTLVIPYDVKPQVSKLGLTATVTQILFQTALATGVIVALL